MCAKFIGILLVLGGALIFWLCMINAEVIPMWWFVIPILIIVWGCCMIFLDELL